MGNWNINIQGVGCHHNTGRDEDWRKQNDADIQFKEFVESLRKAGHCIQSATFTFGSAEILPLDKKG
jgi:hypothetical protein